jgi:hypothetical protein
MSLEEYLLGIEERPKYERKSDEEPCFLNEVFWDIYKEIEGIEDEKEKSAKLEELITKLSTEKKEKFDDIFLTSSGSHYFVSQEKSLRIKKNRRSGLLSLQPVGSKICFLSEREGKNFAENSSYPSFDLVLHGVCVTGCRVGAYPLELGFQQGSGSEFKIETEINQFKNDYLDDDKNYGIIKVKKVNGVEMSYEETRPLPPLLPFEGLTIKEIPRHIGHPITEIIK